MIEAYRVLRNRCKLDKIRIKNAGVFCNFENEIGKLIAEVGQEALSL